MNPIPATIGILTYNSERNLRRALASVRDFADIIIADGGSTDGTLALANECGARVIAQSHPGHPITDFALERNRTLDAAHERWFFHLDSDEIMSPELVAFIRSVVEDAEPSFDAYRVRYQKTNASETHPYRTYREYYQIRLFRTDCGIRYERAVHERAVVPEGLRIGQTEAPWYVPLDTDDLSFSVFAPKAWKRVGITAAAWRPRTPFAVLRGVCIEPTILIAKSLYKMVVVKLRYGKDAIPAKYELLRVVYSCFLAVRFGARALGMKTT